MYNSIYPVNIRPYNSTKDDRISQDNEKEKDGQRHSDNQGQGQHRRPSPNFYTPFAEAPDSADNFQRSTPQPDNAIQNNVYSQPVPSAQSFQTGINISQILLDFQNTVEAIGTPEEVAEEINGYFTLINKQAHSKEPNEKLIKSNLKNASILLDKYISDSLAKPSKVVENWIDTLFLQKVDFSYDESKINPDFRLKFPEKPKTEASAEEEQTLPAQAQTQEPASQEASTVSRPDTSISSDRRLQKMYLHAKKYALINDAPKALRAFQKALNRSVALNDENAQSLIYFEAAKVFDKENRCIPALKNYYRATKKSRDYKIKTKAHYNMAKIYEDFVKEKPAVNHYFVALSYAGETENFAAQSASLANLAGIYSEKSRKNEVHLYTGLATDIVKETENPAFTGAIYAKNAKSCAAVGCEKEALGFYKESTKQYKKTKNSAKKLAQNFEQAAALMRDMGHFRKAENLYKKAYEQYSSCSDDAAMNSVFSELAQLNALK